MATNPSSSSLIDAIVVEYLERRQAGENPTIEEYCDLHPKHAVEIRSLLNTVDLADAKFANDLSDLSRIQSSSLHDRPLEQIAGYRIIREIGRGGMGVVYEAEHSGLGRRAALKILPRQVSQDPDSLKRFIREGKAIAKMHHSNIVPLFEVGEDEGRFFLAMQLIEGRSLDHVIREIADLFPRQNWTDSDKHLVVDKLLPAPSGSKSNSSSDSHSNANVGPRQTRFYQAIARFGAQAADALSYAHQRGFVHRDVKPSNLILDSSGVTWLTDFGLAKSDDDDITHTGDFVGTLRYMAPERFKGVCDAKSDIYGLGLTLYELLTLTPAFDSSDRLSTIRKITNENPPHLRTIDRQIPRDLETIVMKAIDKDPKSRYDTANALAEDLNNFIFDLPINARRHSMPEQLLKWSRRNRTIAAAVMLATTSLLLLAIVATYSAVKQSSLREESEKRGLRLETQKEELLARGEELESQKKEQQSQSIVLKEQSDTLQRNLYFAEMNLASSAALRPSGVETIKARLESTHPDVLGKDLRGWEWHYLLSLINQEKLEWKEGGWTWDVSYSPDGSKIVHAINGYGIVVRSAMDSEIIRVIRTNGAHSAQWSPDGKSIASSDYVGNIFIWDAETYEEKHRMSADEHIKVTRLCWSHDSCWLASSIPVRQEIVIWDAKTGRRESKISVPNNCHWIAFSPVENFLAARFTVDGKSNEAWIYDSGNGEVLAKIPSPGNHVGGVCWSPDGRRLVTSGPIRVWDWKAGKVIAEGPEVDRAAVSWRPGHEQIAFAGKNGISLWDVEGESRIRNFYGQAFVESLCWSPDGNSLASGGLDKTVRTWQVDARAPQREVQAIGHNDDLAWDATGRYLIGNSSKNFTNVWDTETFQISERPFANAKELESNRIWAIDINQQDGRLALGGSNKHVRVWDRSTDEVQVYEGSVGETKALAWASDGRLAAICWPPHYDPKTKSAGPKTANNLVVWDANGKLIGGPKPVHRSFGMGLTWHPDASRIATAAPDGTIRIWESDTLELLLEFAMPSNFFENSELRYSPDGGRLASANQNAIYIWDSDSGEMLGKMDETREDFRSIDWRPDGHMLAAGTYDSTSIWDTEHFRLAIQFPFGVNQVRWAPDGLRLGLSNGKKLQILDATRGYELEQALPRRKTELASAVSNDVNRNVKPKFVRAAVAEVLMSHEWRWCEPVRLSDGINSEHNEYEPFVTVDGLQLFFNSDRPEGEGGYDLYSCQRESIEADWGEPKNLGAAVNSSANDEAAHVTSNGKLLYFNSNRTGNMDLFVSARDDSGQWAAPVALPQPVNSNGTDGEPTLSHDGLTLMFVSTRSNKFDLLIAQRESVDAMWGTIRNMGRPLNAANWQGAPSILSDETGSVVIFHSSEGVKIASRETATDLFEFGERLPGTSILGGVSSPFLWRDGRTLYYRRLDAQKGTYDIWMSKRVKRSEVED